MKLINMLLFLFIITSQSQAAPKLILSSPSLCPGSSAALTISISDGDEPYAGVSARIILPDGAAVTGVTKGPLLSDEFSADVLMTSGQASVIAWSGTSVFSKSDGVLLTLTIRADSAVLPGVYPVRFAEADSVSLMNSTCALSNADGSLSVSPVPVSGSITVFADTDHDGLPDEWEMRYFGNLNQSPDDDPDNDGFTNLTEFLNNTHPMIPQGEINGDMIVDIADAIIALKISCGLSSDAVIVHMNADANADGKIGLEEVIFILQRISGK